MDPVPHRSPRPPRAKERCLALACTSCGQSFALHFMSARAEPSSRTGVPCLNDACGFEVSVMLPPGAFALWVEET
jgi:hypothetical protein